MNVLLTLKNSCRITHKNIYSQLVVQNGTGGLLCQMNHIAPRIQVAFMQFYPLPPDYSDVELPEIRKLPILEKVPQPINSLKQYKMMKRLIDIRGPELVHNQLLHKQFGIIALCGGNIRHGHIEMIRHGINHKLDIKKSFAVWRIDPPWKPLTKKTKGRALGGGKGAIDHYVTPIKAGRIIVEVGGKVEFDEVFHFLENVAKKLPVDAMVVSQKMMDDLYKEEQELAQSNINPFTFQYVIENNMQGCHRWISKYDHIWFGKYI